MPSPGAMHYVANFSCNLKFAVETAPLATVLHAAVANRVFGSGLMSQRMPNDYTGTHGRVKDFLAKKKPVSRR